MGVKIIRRIIFRGGDPRGALNLRRLGGKGRGMSIPTRPHRNFYGRLKGKALKKSHPYETPAFDVWRLSDLQF